MQAMLRPCHMDASCSHGMIATASWKMIDGSATMSMGTLALALCGMMLGFLIGFLIQIPTGMTSPDPRDGGYFYRVLQEAIEIVKAHVFSNPTCLR